MTFVCDERETPGKQEKLSGDPTFKEISVFHNPYTLSPLVATR